ncbi:uncharacterized protein B0P05DRAFT_480284, partial [Gilbertella persicaria]|uniref:uncharacterized protein n=1 Tax=Gilbertella persicaria TaxID=101096 RepID=UPI0022210A5A
FLAYLIRQWLQIEEKISRWCRPAVPEDDRGMLTSNYIVSCHNHLKTVYFSRRKVNRIDQLVFILANDVKFYFTEERE